MESMRASDADREQAIAELHGHVRDGRLTLPEFEERAAGASQARTLGELQALTADLPPAASPPVASPGGVRSLGYVGMGAAAMAAVLLVALGLGVFDAAAFADSMPGTMCH